MSNNLSVNDFIKSFLGDNSSVVLNQKIEGKSGFGIRTKDGKIAARAVFNYRGHSYNITNTYKGFLKGEEGEGQVRTGKKVNEFSVDELKDDMAKTLKGIGTTRLRGKLFYLHVKHATKDFFKGLFNRNTAAPVNEAANIDDEGLKELVSAKQAPATAKPKKVSKPKQKQVKSTILTDRQVTRIKGFFDVNPNSTLKQLYANRDKKLIKAVKAFAEKNRTLENLNYYEAMLKYQRIRIDPIDNVKRMNEQVIIYNQYIKEDKDNNIFTSVSKDIRVNIKRKNLIDSYYKDGVDINNIDNIHGFLIKSLEDIEENWIGMLGNLKEEVGWSKA